MGKVQQPHYTRVADRSVLSPPQLRLSFSRGFNARTYDFLNGAVFDWDLAGGVEVEYNGKEYKVPAAIAFEAGVRGFLNSRTTLLEDEADYEEYMSVGVSAKGKLPIGFEASVDSKVAFHGDLFQSTKTSYAFDILGEEVYEARRVTVEASDLAAPFVSAVKALPRQFSPQTAPAFFDFFDAFGTHFLRRGSFGGYAIMETAIEDSLVEASSKKEVEGAVTAGFSGLSGSASLEAKVAYESSAFLSQHRSQVSINVTSLGGVFNTDKSAYFKSILDSPILVLPPQSVLIDPPELESHAALALEVTNETDLEQAIEAAIYAYLLAGLSGNGLIGSGTSLDPKVVYRAPAPGLIFVSDGSGGQPVAPMPVRADDTDDPQRIVGLTGGARGFWNGNVTAPVAVNTDFVVEGLYASLAMAKYFTIGQGVIEVDEYQRVPSTGQAASDGFLIGVLDTDGKAEGAFASATASVMIDGSKQTIGLASEAYQLSFSVPLPKGTEYAVDFVPSPTCGGVALWFVALQPEDGDKTDNIFGSYHSRQSNRVFRAQNQEGFVLCANDRTTRTAIVLCSTGKQTISPGNGIDYKGLLVSTASVEQTTSGSFALPVTRGAYYATFTTGSFGDACDTSGTPRFFWLPLNPEFGAPDR